MLHTGSTNRASATQLATKLRSREISAVEVVDSCLERIAERDSEIHAWTAVDEAYAREQARALDSGNIRGPLHGIPIAVKDIIATARLPTECGSPIYSGHMPDKDAGCVAAALKAGAIVLGKTATTEFAFLSPTTTANPREPTHTPGGSSSGSAAAVADDMVPLAFGTQTAGSVIRPASYCGVVGYKPTFGMIERSGVKLIAESLDTVGVFARTVSDAALFTGAITGKTDLWQPDSESDEIRIGFCRTHDWNEVEPEAAMIVASVVESLSASGARVSSVELPAAFAELHHAHVAIQGFEAARNLEFEREEHRSSLSPILLTMLDEGESVSETRYKEGKDFVSACRASLSDIFGNCHVLITASATGEAPKGLESTGNPVMNRIWTALHTPCVTIPAANGPNGLPVGVQIVGRPGDDARMLASADWIERQIRASQAVPAVMRTKRWIRWI